MSNTARSSGEHVRKYLDIPLSRLNRYAAIRTIDNKHVQALQEALASPEDLRSNPLEVYEHDGGYVVQDGTHRVSAIRAYYAKHKTAEADPKIPCLVVEAPRTAHDAVVAATAANMRRELSKVTSFAEKVVAISGLVEGYCSAVSPRKSLADVSWREVKAFHKKRKLASLPFAEKPESSNTFAVARGVKPFLDCELEDTRLRVDTRCYELFLAVSSQPLLLDSVSKQEVRPMFEALPAPGNPSLERILPFTVNLSLSYFLLHVPVITGLAADIPSPSSSRGFMRLMYLTSLVRVLANGDSEETSLERRKRRKTSKTSVKTFSRSGGKGSEPSSSDRLSTAVVAVIFTFDRFAQSLSRSSIEEMILPYVYFDEQALTLRSLRSSGDQRSLSSLHLAHSLYRAKVITCAAGNPCPADINPEVWQRAGVEDSNLRLVASTFMRELEAVVADETLYNTTAGGASRWKAPKSEPYEKFHLGEDGVHLPRQIQSLRSAVRALDLGREDSEAQRGSSGPPVSRPGAKVTTAASRQASSARGSGAGGASAGQSKVSANSGREGSPTTPAPPGKRQQAAHPRLPRGSTDIEPQADPEEADPEEAIHRLTGGKWRMEECSFSDFAAPEGVQLVLTDPPYGVRAARGGNTGAAYYDMLSGEDIRRASAKISGALRPGGHAIIFSSYQQAPEWQASLTHQRLAVDPLPIVFVRSPGYYSQSRSQASTQLRNAWEMAVHAVKPAEQNVAMTAVNYGPLAPVPPGTFIRSRHAGWMNVLENVERPSDGETLMDPSSHVHRGRGRMVRPEQKAVKLMQELIARFSQPDDLVLDLFAGTFSTAVACLQMPSCRFRRFAGCEIDGNAFPLAKRRVLSTMSEMIIAGQLRGAEAPGKRDELDKACRSYLARHRRGRVLPRLATHSMSPYEHGLPGHSPLPRHLLLFAASSFREPEVRKWEGIGPDKWPRKDLAFRLQEEAQALLACDATSQGLAIAASTIPQAGDGAFAAKRFAKGDVVAWYGGTVVYEDVGSWTQAHRECGPVGFGVTRSSFETRSLSLSHAEPPASQEAGDLDLAGVWVVAAPFCVGGKVNDPRSASSADYGSSRKANVEFIDDKATEDLSAIATNPFHARLVALRDIAVDEEIFANYGPNFDFSKGSA